MTPLRILVRAPLIALLAALLLALGLQSSLLRLVPADLGAFPLNLLVYAGLVLLLLPALLTRGSPLPASIAVSLPIVTLAAYGESKLDWLRTLKDFGVAEAGGSSFPRLVLAVLVLVLLWTLHAVDFALRLRWRALERGVPPDQANGAAIASLGRSAAAGGFALAATAGLGLAVFWSAALGGTLGLAGLAFVVPLVATALVGLGGYMLVRGARAE